MTPNTDTHKGVLNGRNRNNYLKISMDHLYVSATATPQGRTAVLILPISGSKLKNDKPRMTTASYYNILPICEYQDTTL